MEWVDVTAQIDLSQGDLQHDDTSIIDYDRYIDDRYRLRKMSLWDLYDQCDSKSKQMVIIVDKKATETTSPSSLA
jgi:hypothetical protein